MDCTRVWLRKGIVMEKVNKKEVVYNVYRIAKIASWFFVISLCGAIFSGLVNYGFSLMLGMFSQKAIAQANLGVFNINEFKIIALVALLLIPFTIVGSSLNLFGGLNGEKRLRKSIVDKSLHQSEANVKGSHSADVMTLLTGDTSIVSDFYFQALNYRVVHPLISGIAGLITMLFIDYRFAIISVMLGIVSIVFSMYFTDRSQAAYIKSRDKDQESVVLASEIISNEVMIRQFGIQDDVVSDYDDKNEEYRNEILVAEKIKHIIEMGQALINIISMVGFIGLGYLLSVNQNFDFSMIMLLLPLKSTVAYMFRSLGSSWSFLIEVSTSSSRILKFLDSKDEDRRTTLSDITIDDIDSIISFDDVEFSYDDKLILDRLNLDIKKKTTTAFVGTSGSGKSTIFRLLMGFYDNFKGSIKLGSSNIMESSVHSLRSNIVAVEQDAPLFNKSIYENIALGSLNYDVVTEEMVIEAAKKAGAHDFVMELKEGYNTNVGEAGNNISGGQRQRIAIARALMSDAPVLILDEPTAALDVESERIINETISNLKGEKTVLISAHRLNSIKGVDNIVVLNKGVVEEMGSHETLINNKGFYYTLINSQKEVRYES